MEQLSRAFRNEVHFALRLLVPPRSVLHTLATRENTDLPQFMYSTAPRTSGVCKKIKGTFFLENTFSEEKINKIPIIKGSNKAGVVEICRIKLWCSQRIPIYDWIYALEIQTIWTKVWQLCYIAKQIFTYVNSQSYTLYQYIVQYHHTHNNINEWGCNV